MAHHQHSAKYLIGWPNLMRRLIGVSAQSRISGTSPYYFLQTAFMVERIPKHQNLV
jgi:hypothetical protein